MSWSSDARRDRRRSEQDRPGETDDATPDYGADDSDAHGLLQLASLSNRLASEGRAVKRVKRVQVLGGREIPLGPNCAVYDGYNIHANVHFAAMDRAGLERLCRYVLRPPLALGRVERLACRCASEGGFSHDERAAFAGPERAGDPGGGVASLDAHGATWFMLLIRAAAPLAFASVLCGW